MPDSAVSDFTDLLREEFTWQVIISNTVPESGTYSVVLDGKLSDGQEPWKLLEDRQRGDKLPRLANLRIPEEADQLRSAVLKIVPSRGNPRRAWTFSHTRDSWADTLKSDEKSEVERLLSKRTEQCDEHG